MNSTIDRKPKWRLITAVVALALVCAAAAFVLVRRQEPAPPTGDLVIGRVVDSAGRPVAGAQVGTSYQLADSAEKMRVQISYGDPPVITGKDGGFSLPAAPISYTKAIVARKDGLLGFAIRNGNKALKIQLGTPAELDLAVVKRFGSAEPIGVDLLKGGSALAYGSVSGKGRFAVPVGDLQVQLAQTEMKSIEVPTSLARAQRTVIRVEAQPTAWVKNIGKVAPPFTPVDLHNASDVSAASLRGKWVLVDFWATWCLPCIREMPDLISFYKEHAKDRDRFEIIAVHSPDGKSFAAIKRAYEGLVAKTWKGQDMPFPMVFDPTGATQKRWGVETYPTTLLIDPRGRVAGAGTLADLAKKL